MGRMAGWFADKSERGVWLVRTGLWIYDRYTRKSGAPRHRVFTTATAGSDVPQIDANRYRWVCQYMDAQIRYPERLILSMLRDCEALSADAAVTLQICNAATAHYSGDATFSIQSPGADTITLRPDIIVNATGAWGDQTLEPLPVNQRAPMFGGTKGSHLISHAPALREALGDDGIYAEASDGRLIFILPFGDSVMVGTTDVRFQDDPGEAIAADDEIDYLVEMVNTVLPSAGLTTADVELHYSGVRPLPYRKKGSTAAISRDHSIRKHRLDDIRVLTLIGGKLTTCRAFGELVADKIFDLLGTTRSTGTQDLPYHGGANFPHRKQLQSELESIAADTGFSCEQTRAVFELCGTATWDILQRYRHVGTESLAGTNIPLAFAQYSIECEWVRSLDDLIERRLLLLYHGDIAAAALQQLLDLLVASGTIDQTQAATEIERATARLQKYYGRKVTASGTG